MKIEFLVPFPQFDLQIHEGLIKTVKSLQQLWIAPSVYCDLTFPSNFAVNESLFEINWLINQVQNESSLASEELTRLRHQFASFLDPKNNAPLNSRGRVKRAAPLAFAAVGLFGSGILIGSNDGC